MKAIHQSVVGQFVFGAILTSGLALANAGQTLAATVNATLTADNHYGLFTGDSQGNLLRFIGRNEKGAGGQATGAVVNDANYGNVTLNSVGNQAGSYNWSVGENWTFDLNAGEHLYVVAWDDSSVAETWVGQFNYNGRQLLTGASDWEYLVAQDFADTAAVEGINPGDNGDVPKVGELGRQIANANWQATANLGKNNGTTNPWGKIAGISDDADFLKVATRNDNRYTIFRTKSPLEAKETPEPLAMTGLALVGMVGAARKAKLG
jgi:hypothetical protein